MAKPKKDSWPRVVRFEEGKVTVFRRANGWYALSWREEGRRRTTTRTEEAAALKFAADKARQIGLATGKRWVTPAQADELAALEKLAGPDEGAVGRLLSEVRTAREILCGRADLPTAARWFAEQGPMQVEEHSVLEAVTRFLAEYDKGSVATRRTFGTELDAFAAAHGKAPLLEISEVLLRNWVDRPRDGCAPAPRTVKNRITTLGTFLNRCKAWGWLPEGPRTAAERLRRPKLPSAGREILSLEEGEALLKVLADERPELSVFVVIGGWLGLRPSEIQRLRWSAFDWERGYLHLCPKVAAKIQAERFVPMDGRVAARLRELREQIKERGGRWKAGDPVTLFRAREFVSVLARDKDVVDRWPADVLRHSFCSYRLAVLGDLARVAEEAGNSPAVIKSNYRRPVRAEDGEAWWALLQR